MKHLVVRTGLLVILGACAGCEVGIEEPPAPAARAEKPGDQQQAPQPVQQQGEPPAVTYARLVRGHLQFVEGYSAGYAEAVRQSKPMLLFFTAPWCGYCRQMAEDAFRNPQVVRLSGHFVCVLVDADAEPGVCRQFGVTGYPTIQFLSPRGAPLNRLVGKQPGPQVIMAMQAALQNVALEVDATDVGPQ